MHHYGENAVKVDIVGNTFTIYLRNHVTGAVITVSGPLEGIVEKHGLKLDRAGVELLGNDLAHFLREHLR